MADSLFGDAFLGPEAISVAYGVSIDSITVPPIPYTIGELKFFRRLGYILVFQIDSIDGKPLTMQRQIETYQKCSAYTEKLSFTIDSQKENFFVSEVPQAGWRLVSGTVIPGSTGQDYMLQTALLQTYPEDYRIPGYTANNTTVFADAMQKADSCLKRNKKIRKSTGNQYDTTGLQQAAKLLATMQTNISYRETAVEVCYRIILFHAMHQESLFLDEYVWTNSLSSDNKFVGVGSFFVATSQKYRNNGKTEVEVLVKKDYPNTCGPVRGTTFVYPPVRTMK